MTRHMDIWVLAQGFISVSGIVVLERNEVHLVSRGLQLRVTLRSLAKKPNIKSVSNKRMSIAASVIAAGPRRILPRKGVEEGSVGLEEVKKKRSLYP